MLRMGPAAVAAALLVAGAAVAQEDDFVELDRLELADGSAYLSVAEKLDGRIAEFSLDVLRQSQDGDVVSGSGGQSFTPVRIADAKRHARLRIDRVMCEEPVAIVGTVTRKVARVEWVAADGTVRALRRRRAPSGWRSRVRVIGAVQPSAASVREVRARLRGGKVVARVRPEPLTPCP